MPDTILLFSGKKRNRHAFGSFFLHPGQQNANCSETTIIYLVNSLNYISTNVLVGETTFPLKKKKKGRSREKYKNVLVTENTDLFSSESQCFQILIAKAPQV